jgi:putative transposase
MAKQIGGLFQATRQVYGSPRLHAELQAQGVRCSRNRVARLMRQAGISAKRRRLVTTDSRHAQRVAPNRLQRDFMAAAPNEKWVADITGVWTSQGWCSPFHRPGPVLTEGNRLGHGTHSGR